MELGARLVTVLGETLGELGRPSQRLPARPAECVGDHPERYRSDHPLVADAVAGVVGEPEAETEREDRADADRHHRRPHQAEQQQDLARSRAAHGGQLEDHGDDRARDDQERAQDVEQQQPVVLRHASEA
jgi:hypothetical protein